MFRSHKWRKRAKHNVWTMDVEIRNLRIMEGSSVIRRRRDTFPNSRGLPGPKQISPSTHGHASFSENGPIPGAMNST